VADTGAGKKNVSISALSLIHKKKEMGYNQKHWFGAAGTKG
jgi:hypothetical protein